MSGATSCQTEFVGCCGLYSIFVELGNRPVCFAEKIYSRVINIARHIKY